MVRPVLCTGFAALLSGAVFGQAAAATPAFEIAEVYVSAPSANPGMIPFGLRGSRYELRNATLVDLISMAYGLNYRRLAGGPAWLDSDRFDAIAKAPSGTPPQTLRVMLQGLLADRFQLKVHMATKPVAQYALVLGKGPVLLKAGGGSVPAGCGPQARVGARSNVTYSCRNLTMAAFGKALPGFASRYLAYKTDPVMDLTGLKGSWDFNFEFTDNNFQLPALGADGITIFDAIEKLGLKLDIQRLPTQVLVVDRVRSPTANPPGAAGSLAAPPLPDMVVEVKPPAVRARGAQPPYGVLLDFQNVTLKSLVVGAMGLSGEDPAIAGGPDWLDSTHFDIVARPAAPGPPSVTLDQDALRVVERRLMEERFKLATHIEIRPWTVYALVAEKQRPKLKEAHRSDQSFCEPEAPRDPMLTNSFVCQNTSMTQLAERLRGMGAVYIPNRPIVDATGIKGSFDFVLGYTGTFGPFRSQECPPVRPAGCLTVYEALEKELGLELELQKRPMPVVDRTEQKPTDR